ncbi:hypothetical protein D3C85_1241970 [compost metagenome]
MLDQQARGVAHVGAPFARHPGLGRDLAETPLRTLQGALGPFMLGGQHFTQQNARAIGVGHRRLRRAGRHPDQVGAVRLGQVAGLLDPLGVVGFVIDIDDQTGPSHGDLLAFQNDRTPGAGFGP